MEKNKIIMDAFSQEISDLRRKSYPKMSSSQAVKQATELMLFSYTKEELKEAIKTNRTIQLFGLEKSYLNAINRAKKPEMRKGGYANGGGVGVGSYKNHKIGDMVEVWQFGGGSKIKKIVGFEDKEHNHYILEDEKGNKSYTPKKYIANLSGEFPFMNKYANGGGVGEGKKKRLKKIPANYQRNDLVKGETPLYDYIQMYALNRGTYFVYPKDADFENYVYVIEPPYNPLSKYKRTEEYANGGKVGEFEKLHNEYRKKNNWNDSDPMDDDDTERMVDEIAKQKRFDSKKKKMFLQYADEREGNMAKGGGVKGFTYSIGGL